MNVSSTDNLWLSGNEAIALGAWEAGVQVASGYPGTPSTEIMGNLGGYEGVYTEWAPNEKVGLEVGLSENLSGFNFYVKCLKVRCERYLKNGVKRGT